MSNDEALRPRLATSTMRGISFLQRPELVLKYSSLIFLVLQNASQALYLRWVSVRQQEKFLSTVCVFFQEVVKLGTCILLVCLQEKSFWKCCRSMYKEIIGNWLDTLKVCIPAICYVLQNNLLYIAIAHLPSAVFMVTYQLKILTTALFTVMILRRHLSLLQWLSLVLLFVGIALVQVDQRNQEIASKLVNMTSTTTTTTMSTIEFFTTPAAPIKHDQNVFVGVGAVLIACLLSGFAGIYFEKILKQRTEVSVWIRNVQLAVVSLPVALVTVFLKDHEKVAARGFMVGFDVAVWGAVMFGSLGGLIIAVVMKFADNILKAFATSFSIVLACVCSVILFSFYPTLMFLGGTALVIGAIFIYSLFPYKQKKYIPAATEPPPPYVNGGKPDTSTV